MSDGETNGVSPHFCYRIVEGLQGAFEKPKRSNAERSEWDERPVYANTMGAAGIEGPGRTGISDEGRSERARAANEFQNGSKVKRLWLGSTAHKFGGVGSGAPRKNRTLEIRRLAQSIRDVAFGGRRESVAEARPRCGSADRLIWTQPSARQAQLLDKPPGQSVH
jgi:hypothetical protein